MAKKITQADKIRNFAAANPSMPIADISKKLNLRYQAVYNVLKIKETTLKKARSARVKEVFKEAIKEFDTAVAHEEPEADNVNHPAHYKVGGVETIDFIEAKSLNFHLGNVVKYIARADHKGDKLENLHKARWYLNREIARLTPN